MGTDNCKIGSAVVDPSRLASQRLSKLIDVESSGSILQERGRDRTDHDGAFKMSIFFLLSIAFLLSVLLIDDASYFLSFS